MSREQDEELDLGSLKVRRRRLSEQVVDHIQLLAIRGELKPGDKLPSEHSLGQQLGVSRTVIREAIRSLQEWGWIRVVPGSGAYVTSVGPSAISTSIGQYVRSHGSAFRDLIELRRLLEVEVAGLAAERATEVDIQDLQNALSRMNKAVSGLQDRSDKLQDFVEADAAFHRALAKASTNALLLVIFTSIGASVQEFSRRASLVPGMAEKAIASHERILQHVRRHETAACRKVMHGHMDDAHRLLVELSDKHQMS